MKIKSVVVEGFSIEVEGINAEKDILKLLPNLNVPSLKKQYDRLRRLPFTEEETRNDSISVHIGGGRALRISSSDHPGRYWNIQDENRL